MNQPRPPESIIVGIDGSDAAINAANWAVKEAVSREIPLRLIHVIPERQEKDPPDDLNFDRQFAETTLRAATRALYDIEEPMKIETAILQGSSASVLIDESHYGAMVCVGSVGIGRAVRKFVGSTAEAVARTAHCPRSDHPPRPQRDGFRLRLDRGSG
jgi:nucleotide-binding universal stress UspA family protein